MLSLKEIIHADVEPEALDPDKLANEQDLLEKVNKIRVAWNQAMTVSSGIRTWAHHIEIYKEKAAKKQAPFLDGDYDESKIPKLSKHLETVTDAAAVDIADPGLKITDWLKNTPEGQKALEDADLYCEEGNTNWVHFQNKPFHTYQVGGTRWFKP